MQPIISPTSRIFKVRGMEIFATDSPQQHRQKLARIALDEMYQFVAVLDEKGILLEVNRAALEGAGLNLTDVEGKPFWDCFWWTISRETQETLRAAVARAAQGEFIRYDVEVYGRAHGKETIIIDFSMIPVKDETGKVVFIVPEGRDITAKKAYEVEIAQKNHDLQALLQRIQELDEIKTQFFANVSHELRTPLALILGPADRLVKNHEAMGFEQRQEAARVIARNARMVLKHVNDLLDISKSEAGKLKIELRDTEIVSLFRLTASHFELLATDRKITFWVEAKHEIISAIDPEKIQRVVMNLLSNAFKFVPDGGKVRVKIQRSEKHFLFAVDDTGPGIKPELRQVIFERFRQGEGGANRQFGGTGLGLAIAREFIEMHKGTLEVLDSELGGACFQVTLPMSRLSETSVLTPALDQVLIDGFIEELRPQAHFEDNKNLIDSSDCTKSTVLVVEDNAEMNRFIAETLSADYNVITAIDGEQGLAKALLSNPSLIVTDIMMPKMSGVEMIAEMQNVRELANIPILLLTAKADEELKIKLLAAGAHDFVAKPFSEGDLRARVRNLIGLKQAQERYRTLFQSMDEGFCIVEVIFDENKIPVDYRFLEINGAFEKQTGLKGANGRRMRELAPEHEQHWFDIYGKIALTGESIRFENRAAALHRWYEVYAFRVGRPESRQVAIFFNDITQRKCAEQELNRAHEKLIAASRAKDDFLAVLSHELRTPLNPILLIASEAVHNRELSPRVRMDFEMIRKNVELEARLIDDLLDLTRITQNKIILDKQPVNICQILEDAIANVREDLAHKNIILKLDLNLAETIIFADPVRLQQVFWNVLKNAVKFTPEGGNITVVNETIPESIIAIKIIDSGIGMTLEEMARIFNAFSQGDHADGDRGHRFGGLGLGLAISRKLLELHSGRITAMSDGPNQGSTFIIELPLASKLPFEGHPTNSSVRATPMLQKPIGRRILLVEDHEPTRMALAQLLLRRNHTVAMAATINEARILVHSQSFDLVISDIGLPDGNGYDLMKELREHGIGRGIALTGYGMEEDVARSRRAGFVTHLTKPVRIQSLEAALELAAAA